MLDHRLKAFVISIRGTFSLSDVITDLSLGAQQLELEKDEEEGSDDDFHYVHVGVHKAAMHILSEMQAKNLFNYKPAGYKTVMASHSLGSSICLVIALMLKQKHPSLGRIQCLNLCPMGAALSPSL